MNHTDYPRITFENHKHIVLAIAGSDSSAGAGIQADLKTISAIGGYGATAITAVTAQNTLGVQHVHPIPPASVTQQIESVLTDLRPQAVKIGMIPNTEVDNAIANALSSYNGFIVYDPVMISTSGRHLMDANTIHRIKSNLLPLCSLITPNLNEATLLDNAPHPLTDTRQMQETALRLSEQYHTSVLVKGGHLSTHTLSDVLACRNHIYHYSHERINTYNLHGTGCTLSSAIATYLTAGYPLPEAVTHAVSYLYRSIAQAVHLKIGEGNGPLWHF